MVFGFGSPLMELPLRKDARGPPVPHAKGKGPSVLALLRPRELASVAAVEDVNAEAEEEPDYESDPGDDGEAGHQASVGRSI